MVRMPIEIEINRKNDNTFFTHKIVVIWKFIKSCKNDNTFFYSQDCCHLKITRLFNVGYLTRMLTVFMLITFYHKIDQSQDYLMQVISQICWQDCNHKNDRMTRI